MSAAGNMAWTGWNMCDFDSNATQNDSTDEAPAIRVRIRCGIALLLVVGVMIARAPGYADSGPLTKLDVSTSLPSLGGRLSLLLPSAAREEARQSSIMEAP